MELAPWWPLPSGTAVRDRLVEAYSNPARRYHDARHLAEVFARVDDLAAGGAAFDREAVLRGACYHAAVFDGRPGAEERSAARAGAELPALGVDDRTVAEVLRLVRLTETHRPADDDANGCVLSDADLAILAAPPARYAEYVASVRAEYAHVPDDLFASGRAAVLGDLLAKPHLFHTAYAREHWEAPARANVQAELTGQL